MGKNRPSIEAILNKVKEAFAKEPELARLFETCYTNTLDTTVKQMEDGTTHVITGDIPAMWLRDSTAQLRPYLIPAAHDEQLAELIAGLVRRQFQFICIEPYANAFNEKPDGSCWEKDFPDQDPWVWEQKFEIDSLCYPLQLAYLLWKNTGCTSQFDENFKKGAYRILDVFYTEQNHEERSSYRFERPHSFHTDTLSRGGKGSLTRPDTGLIWSGFRPSDDSCVYGYLIPSNMFAWVVLGYLAEIARTVYADEELAKRAGAMRTQVREGIERYAVVRKMCIRDRYGKDGRTGL